MTIWVTMSFSRRTLLEDNSNFVVHCDTICETYCIKFTDYLRKVHNWRANVVSNDRIIIYGEQFNNPPTSLINTMIWFPMWQYGWRVYKDGGENGHGLQSSICLEGLRETMIQLGTWVTAEIPLECTSYELPPNSTGEKISMSTVQHVSKHTTQSKEYCKITKWKSYIIWPILLKSLE